MTIYELIEKRRSVRNFRDDPIQEDALKRILGAGRLAPSAHNAQDYKFIIVKDAEKIKVLAKAAAGQKFVGEAPIIIVPVSLKPEYIMSCGVPAYAVDIAIAIDYMTLAAAEEGLGTCWIGAFNQEEVRKILKIPEKYKAVILLPLGVPDDEPAVKSRKKLWELICEEEFSE